MYFDEIHYGGSTEDGVKIIKNMEKILKIKTFTPITATFAKPVLEYDIKNIFRWSYEDQQSMKKITEENKKTLIDRRQDDIQKNIMQKLFDEYYKNFNNQYLSILRSQYLKHPELVFLGFDFLENYIMKDKIFTEQKDLEELVKVIEEKFYPKLVEQKIYDFGGTQDGKYKTCHTELWFIPFSSDGSDKKEVSGIVKPNSEKLLNVLEKSKYFKEKYDFFVCHGNTKGMDEKYKDKDNITIYKNNKESINKQIERAENKAKGKRKSLIVITGQMLRLGISLKNVRIALNFNDISAVDPNIQTIFRVMTENENKSNGIYMDFKKDRSYNFMYQYMNYSSKKKLQERLAETILSLNYNACNYKSFNWEDISDYYHNIYENFKNISTDKIMDRNTLVRILENNLDIENLKKYSKYIPKADIIKSKETTLPKTPKRKKITRKNVSKDNEISEIDVLDVAEFIDSYTRILAFFNKEYKCYDIETCAQNAKNNIDQIVDLCKNCGEDVLACYGKRINNYNRQTYKDSLTGYIELINSDNFIKDHVDEQFDTISNYVNTEQSLIKEKSRKKYNTPKIFFTSDTEDKTTEKIDKFVEKYLPIREVEKDKFGEVMTPPELITEMLMKLPEDVWSNPNLKWLDPANGIGNFPIYVYYGLMIGLENEIPDDEERSKHILKNMLYMVELNPKNVQVSKKIFGKDANIYCGSFLPKDKGKEPNWKRVFGIEKFDVIVGNPPYNKDGTGKGGGVFWKNFVFIALEHLNKDGLLLYVHPPGWRKPIGEYASAGDVWNKFKKYCLYFVKISDLKIENFPKVDYYILKKSERKCKTHIINEFNGIKNDEHLDISKLPFIPHFINQDVLSVMKKLFSKPGERFKIVYNQSFKPKKADETKGGVPHTYYYDTGSKKYKLVFKKYENGKTPEYIDKSKIIMTYKAGKKQGHLYPVYFEKDMGSARNTMYQEISRDDNKENIISLLNSNLIHFLLKITQYSESPNHINEFKILNMIGKPNTGSLKTDQDIYKYYGITKKEQQLIDKVIKLE